MKKFLFIFMLIPFAAFPQTLTLSGSSINLEIVSLADSVATLTDFISATGDTLTDVHENLTARAKSAADSIQAGHVALTARTKTLSDSVTAGHTALTAREKTIADSLTAVHTALKIMEKAEKDTLTAINGKLETRAKTLKDSVDVTLQEAREVAEHFHTKGRWFGRSALQAGNDWAKQDTLGVYLITSGDNTWGVDAADTTKVIGSDDTPTAAGNKYFDMHKIFVSASTSTSLWKIRFVWSDTNFADGLAAGNYSESIFMVASAASRLSPVDIWMPRLPSGTKVWAQGWNATDNATLSFLVGIHEYIQ